MSQITHHELDVCDPHNCRIGHVQLHSTVRWEWEVRPRLSRAGRHEAGGLDSHGARANALLLLMQLMLQATWSPCEQWTEEEKAQAWFTYGVYMVCWQQQMQMATAFQPHLEKAQKV